MYLFLKCICNALFFLGLHSVMAQSVDSYEKRVGENYVVIVDPPDSIRTELAKHLIVDRVEHFPIHVVYAYAGDQGIRFLQESKLSFNYIVSPDQIIKEQKSDYPTFEMMENKLKELAFNYPSLLSLHSIGRSVKGRELYFVKISDNVNEDEREPEIKLVSSMHGNEIVGRELLMILIEELVKNYSSDSKIKKIVDNSEIWIMPSMNPDGSFLRRRGNANNIDLNRDFPEMANSDPNSLDGRQVETKKMMEFQAKRQFILGANFHGGAVVVNYPWDHSPKDPPNRIFVEYLSKEYARSNPPMYASSYFPEGVTNGYDWYPVYGGMQDWSYGYHQFLELTVEVSMNKWPLYETISQYWSENRSSLIRFLQLAQQNIHGIVVDKQSGKFIESFLKVKGIDFTMKSSPLTGEFYHLLLPGKYVLQFWADGYKSKDVEIIVGEDGGQPLFVALEK